MPLLQVCLNLGCFSLWACSKFNEIAGAVGGSPGKETDAAPLWHAEGRTLSGHGTSEEDHGEKQELTLEESLKQR